MRSSMVLAGVIAVASCGGPATPVEPSPVETAEPVSNRLDDPRQRLRLVYSIELPAGSEGDEALAHAAEVIRARLQSIDDAEVSVDDQMLVVVLPPLDEPAIESARQVASRTGRLEFRLVDSGAERMRRIAEAALANPPSERGIEVEEDYWVHGATYRDLYLTAADRDVFMSVEEARRLGCYVDALSDRVINGQLECPVSGRTVLADYLAELAAADPALAIDDAHEVVYEPLVGTSPRSWRTYYVHRDDPLAGIDVTQAEAAAGQRQIRITLDDEDARRFEQVTAENVGRKLAVLIDNVVVMAPIIQETIAGGKLHIALSPGTTGSEVDELVTILRSGPLPGPLVQEAEDELPVSRPGPDR